MTETYFKQMLHNAAADAGVGLRQIEARQQSPDHPILWNVPETDYLKFFIFQIVWFFPVSDRKKIRIKIIASFQQKREEKETND